MTNGTAQLATATDQLAKKVKAAGDRDDALAIYLAVLPLQRKLNGVVSNPVGNTLTGVAGILREKHNYAESEPYAREALDIRQQIYQPGSWGIASAKSDLGVSLLGAGEYDEAEFLLVAAYRELNAAFSPTRTSPPPPEQYAHIRKTLDSIVSLYKAWNKPAEAAKWRAEIARWQATTHPTTSPSQQASHGS
jgi:hypothetical protein